MSEDEELREAGSRGKLEEEGLVKKSVEKIKKYITRWKKEKTNVFVSLLWLAITDDYVWAIEHEWHYIGVFWLFDETLQHRPGPCCQWVVAYVWCVTQSLETNYISSPTFFTFSFLAPSGAQGVTLSVRPSVCPSGTILSKGLNLHRSLIGLSQVSLRSVSG